MERIEDHAVTVFTDGSMKERPRRGGLAFLFVTTNEDGTERIDEYSPDGVLGATNQEMEIRAVREALSTLVGRRSPIDISRFRKVVVYTDSTTVNNGYAAARGRWQQSGWTGRGGRPLIHADLWREIIRLVNRLPIPVHVTLTEGKGSAYTKRVDKLAKDSAQRPFGRPKIIRHSRRKRSTGSVDIGSVPVEGQLIEIQIISSEWLPHAKRLYYKYEIVSGDLEGAVDQAFSDQALRTRHQYRVRMNDDPDYPQFAEIVETIGSANRSSA